MKKKLVRGRWINLAIIVLIIVGFLLRINISWTTTHDEALQLDEAKEILKGKSFYMTTLHPFIQPLLLALIIKFLGITSFFNSKIKYVHS